MSDHDATKIVSGVVKGIHISIPNKFVMDGESEEEPGPDNRYPLTGLEAFTAMVRDKATIARECGFVRANVNGVWTITDRPRELFMRYDGGLGIDWRTTDRDWEDDNGWFQGHDILTNWRIVPKEEATICQL